MIITPEKPYVKPIIEKQEKMTFPIDIINKMTGQTMVCRQCSSCHSCR